MPRRVLDGRAVRATAALSLQQLYDLAVQDIQRPGNIGAGLKILETLTNIGYLSAARGPE